MTGLHGATVSAPKIQFVADGCKADEDYYPLRHCLDCPLDITEMHGNQKRCPKCRKEWRKARDRRAKAEGRTKTRNYVTAHEVLLYLKRNAPKSLETIRQKIMRQMGRDPV